MFPWTFKQRRSMSASEPFRDVRIIKRIFCATAMGLTALASAARAGDASMKPLPPVFDPAAIDQSVDPCVDFYQYACGAWLKATPIPPDQQIWWRISELDEHTRAVLAAILEEAAAGKGPKTENRRKIGDYYASCLDEAAIDAKGLKPFTPELERIAALKDKKGLAEEIARLHLLGATPLFSFSSAQDYTDATMMIAQADQDGFALPDRDYYLIDEFKGERADYRAHLTRIFGLLGDGAKKAKAEADAVMRVETALAKAAMGLVERREPKNVHHKMTLAEFMKLTPIVRLDGLPRRGRRPRLHVARRGGSGLLQGPRGVAEVYAPHRLEGLSALDPHSRASSRRRRRRSSTKTSRSSTSGSVARRRSRRAGSAASTRRTSSSAMLSARRTSSASSAPRPSSAYSR